MDIYKQLEEIKSVQTKLDTTYLANISRHRETIEKFSSTINFKENSQRIENIKIGILSNTNEILVYEDYLYKIMKKNLNLIEKLYKELEKRQ